MKRAAVNAGVLIVAAWFGAGCYTSPAVGDRAIDFKAADAAGRPVELASYAGRVTVLDFWATWCATCRRASPHVQALHERYGDDPRVAVVGVHRDVDYRKGTPQEYMAEHGYTYDLIPDGRKVAEAYGVWALPQFFVIAPDGTIVHHQTGFGADDVDAFAEIIDAQLAAMEG
jgi:peroxiredoxin